ncbi:SNF1-related protein kinase regulatory subunit gamma-1 [Nicotiana tabacum]|uniref:SNF1-related protein kinase regulatory subunit gamma-1 n=1 Tax=Nicotiana tabacum TaxID=4097 RepID=A0A1S4CXR2_TOBAC|nr:SNF1-related protein kinase regulatory subunit gamma-1 [Nicotiana tomentosiformis]XP_016505945.1 PREDICTED: SNF1-related protein kinase regulatory subunit gamma-1-like [Nicotiana tabacum]XP_018628504.1 SNF1-related protein kinase regulatory subunit gamma-1 [Nicotiana tomentosiformis]XP_033513709.1 SNF1-related protein kinase regulatory subunit gamma-1 [Nicotiana tomentosiformis]
MVMEEGCQTPRSPEAKVGMQVEDLWDVQEPQLSPTEKLNACFENIPVSDFPPAPSNQVIEIRSDATLAEAVKLLSRHKILSAPVVDVDAPEDASWIDRYIGIVEFAGIVVWILHQSEKMEGNSAFDSVIDGPDDTLSPALAAAVNGVSSPRFRSLHPESPTATSGNFFETLTSSDLYKNTKVRDISGSFRWAPFLALQKSNSFLTMLLLLSKYKMKSIPVVDLGEWKIDNIITQSAVIHMLEECAGLHWFESWGSKKLYELGLPLMKPSSIIQVNEDEPVLQAFKLMRQKGVGGVPVVESGGRKAIGNISIRDIQFLLIAPEIYKDYRSITAKNFLTSVQSYLEKHEKHSPYLSSMVTCRRDNSLKEVIMKLDSMKIHRIYVVDDKGNLEGVITLRDIISKLVHEPRGYFGDFFDGVLPLPANSRV